MNAIADMPSSTSTAAFDTPPGAPLIEVRDLKKRFGEVEVLRGVDLEIARSEVVCIIGPSGSGKSTLLRCLAALETYDQGDVRIEGELLGYSERNGKRVRPTLLKPAHARLSSMSVSSSSARHTIMDMTMAMTLVTPAYGPLGAGGWCRSATEIELLPMQHASGG